MITCRTCSELQKQPLFRLALQELDKFHEICPISKLIIRVHPVVDYLRKLDSLLCEIKICVKILQINNTNKMFNLLLLLLFTLKLLEKHQGERDLCVL